MGAVTEILSRRPLWMQLILLSIALAVPLMFSSYFMYTRLVDNERESLRKFLVLNARTLAGLVDNEISTHAAIATTLSYSPALRAGDYTTFLQETTNALKVMPGSWLDLSDSDGKILFSTYAPRTTVLATTEEPALVAAAIAGTVPQVGNLVKSVVTTKLSTFVRVGQAGPDGSRHVLSIGIPPERFQALLDGKYTNGEVVAIVDRERKFVARIPDIESRLGTLASEGWRAAMDRAPSGSTENKTVEGNWSITGYASTRHGWTVGVAQLESRFQNPLLKILWSSLVVSLGIAAFGFLLAGAIALHASRGMANLAKAARGLGAGEQVDEQEAPFAEARTIAKNLAVASRELSHSRNALALANTELEKKVTERTQELEAEMARRQEAETTLRQVQKIETLGQLTGGIAHDFNNMLTIIIGNLDTVQRRLKKPGDPADLTKPVDNAMQGARNAAGLTQRLLAFSRQQPLQVAPVNLNAVASGMSNLLERTVGETIKVETVCGAGLWMTLADANQIENSLLNLVVNARDAMPDGGKLCIETANVYLDDDYVDRFGDVKSGQYVMLSVADTGTGIPPEKLRKVFEPFFTTKGPGKGTGLGLAMVHGFVKQSGGHVGVYSEEGHGTTVKLYFPRLNDGHAFSAAPATQDDNLNQPPRARKGETVLLVEDDGGVREYAVGLLQELGYRVLVAEDGTTALATYRSAKRVDLLFTDVVLGGALNGRQLADELQKLRPSLPVLFTTGYTRNAIIHHGRLDPGVNLLNKPYGQREAATKIRAAIDQLRD